MHDEHSKTGEPAAGSTDLLAPTRLSRKCCQKCGERIRGSVYRLNKKTLCGLCIDDEINALGYGR